MAVTTLIPHIPDIITSATLASTLTLIGVAISNIGNTKRALLQLEHDRAEKTKEREISIKREAYLDFSDKYINAVSAIASLPITKTELAEETKHVTSFQVILSKVLLTASEDTVIKALLLSKDFTILFATACERYIPVGRVKSDMDITSSMSEQQQIEIDRLLSTMGLLRESGELNETSYTQLSKSLEFHMGQKKKYDDELNDLWIEHNKEIALYNSVTQEACQKIDIAFMEIMIDLRNELGLKINPEKIKKTIIDNNLYSKDLAENLFKNATVHNNN